jgi:hypothetical protein
LERGGLTPLSSACVDANKASKFEHWPSTPSGQFTRIDTSLAFHPANLNQKLSTLFPG